MWVFLSSICSSETFAVVTYCSERILRLGEPLDKSEHRTRTLTIHTRRCTLHNAARDLCSRFFILAWRRRSSTAHKRQCHSELCSRRQSRKWIRLLKHLCACGRHDCQSFQWQSMRDCRGDRDRSIRIEQRHLSYCNECRNGRNNGDNYCNS